MKRTAKATKPARRRTTRTGAGNAVNPDHIAMHWVVVAGVLVSLAAAVATSVNGLVFVGSEQGLPAPMQGITAVMIDVPLIVLTLARGALAKRGRGTAWLLVFIVALTAYSSFANLAHSIDSNPIDSLGALLGATTNAIAPWLILLMTEVLWLLTTRGPRQPAAPRATGAAPQPKPKRTRRTTKPEPEPDPDPEPDPGAEPQPAPARAEVEYLGIA